MSNTHSELMLEASEAAYALGAFQDFDGVGGYERDTTFGVDGQIKDENTGFRVIAYVNTETNERVLTFTGTQGLQDAFQDLKIGWDQWSNNSTEVLRYMDLHAESDPIHITGHSLGGALAQYAAYQYSNEFLNDPQNAESALNITLTTFNAPGGLYAINKYMGGYDPFLMANLDSNAIRHYWLDGDLVSHLGNGHVGENTYKVNSITTHDFIVAKNGVSLAKNGVSLELIGWEDDGSR